MPDYIADILREVSPLVAGFITSTLLPALISRWSVKRIGKKIDSVERSATDREILERLDRIENEVLILRGKRK